MLALPKSGRWQGELRAWWSDGSTADVQLATNMVLNEAGKPFCMMASMIDITERKQAETRINELAYFDQLTSLPNRTLLMDRLKQTMAASTRTGAFGALLFVDLDKFKTINDTLGHAAGDQLLKQASGTRCRNCYWLATRWRESGVMSLCSGPARIEPGRDSQCRKS